MILDYLLIIKTRKMIRRLIIVISYITVLPSILCFIGYAIHLTPKLDLSYKHADKFNEIQWFGYLLLLSIPGLILLAIVFFVFYFLVSLLTGVINYIIKDDFEINWSWLPNLFNFFKHIIKLKK